MDISSLRNEVLGVNEKAKRIEEKLRELGINSIEELNAAIKRESLNISLMVCKGVNEKC